MNEWANSVRRDLATFSDSGAPLDCQLVGTRLTAHWMSRRQTLTATFDHDDESGITVEFGGRALSYRAFLSDPLLSDMRGLAKMIVPIESDSFYVHTRATHHGGPGQEEPAREMLQCQVEDARDDVTTVVFVTGDAGAGKTEVLKELVRHQADRFILGETDWLYLYVNAQGRALARLEEALATELQDLKATLTYHSVSTLSRNRLLVPVIDGFDELLGVTGYEDAFSSLRRFLDELGGSGRLIAAARSAYYEQELLTRATNRELSSQGLAVEPIEIQPWGVQEFDQYIQKKFLSSESSFRVDSAPTMTREQFTDKMREVFASEINAPLRSKPFFVAKTAEFVLAGKDFSAADLLDQLVNGYLDREQTSKLLDETGQPLLQIEQIRALVQMICEEMWASETRSLDVQQVRVAAEVITLDSGLSESSVVRVRERAPYMAFFTAADIKDRVEFEHEIFFAYFLGDTIFDAVLRAPDNLYSILFRSPLPEGASDRASKLIDQKNLNLASVIANCGAAADAGPLRSVQAQENAGQLIAAMLNLRFRATHVPSISSVSFQSVVFAGRKLSNVHLRECTFFRVEFRRTDLSSTTIEDCSGREVRLQDVLVNPQHTILQIKGLNPRSDVFGLRVRRADGEIAPIYRPDETVGILASCQLPGIESSPIIQDVHPEFVQLLESLLLKFRRANMIWPEDEQNKSILNHKWWPELERLLVDAGILSKEERRQHAGPNRYALRRNLLPEAIMRGLADMSTGSIAVDKFWMSARKGFPFSSPNSTPESVSKKSRA